MIDPKKYPVVADLLTSDADPDATYEIVRHYQKGDKKVMKKGLSLEEAKEWCKDPETSSRTAEEPANVKHTEEHGPWFDGWTEE